MTTTEERIAAALSARAGGITMDTSTIEKRFAQVREREVQDRRRRRGLAVGAAALATAAAVAAAFVFGDGVLGDEQSLPSVAEQVETDPAPKPPVPPGDVVVTGEVFPEPGSTYVAEAFAAPFSFQVPATGAVPGRWRIGPPAAQLASVGLDGSESTGYATVDLFAPEQTYAPDRAWTEQTELVDAPRDAAGWVEWFEATGQVQVSDRAPVEVGGVSGERFTLTPAADLPPAYDGCAPSTGCVALLPLVGSIGDGAQAGLFEGYLAEVTVLQVRDRAVLVSASGLPSTQDQWLPLLRQVVDSLRFG